MIGVRSALVVVAHPDDESFGLGGVVARLTAAGVDVRVLCLTHGEASTLGTAVDLGDVRATELTCAAAQLGVRDVTLLGHADGALADVPDDVLDGIVDSFVGDAELLVVFESGGVTGHPDHRAATAAAERVAARLALPVLEWGVAPEVADALNDELGTRFVGIAGDDVVVDRVAQRRAIDCHASQAHDNPVLERRLALQGDVDRVRVRRLWSSGRRSRRSPLPVASPQPDHGHETRSAPWNGISGSGALPICSRCRSCSAVSRSSLPLASRRDGCG